MLALSLTLQLLKKLVYIISAGTYLEEELSRIGSSPQRAPSNNESKSLGCKVSTLDLVNEGVKGIFVCVLRSVLIQ